MNAYAYSHALEFREDQELRRKGWMGSVILHGLALLLLFTLPKLSSSEAQLTEFTWLVDAGTIEEMVEAPAPPVVAIRTALAVTASAMLVVLLIRL